MGELERLPVAGVVLAGGQSRRLGRDKALLEVEGCTLLERTLDILRSFAEEVVVIGPPERAALTGTVPVVPDAVPGAGPLGAIATALQSIRADRAVVVGCDMPFLSAPLLRYLVACSDGYDLAMPRIGDQTQQLHAVYRRSALPAIAAQLSAGDRAIHRVLPKLRVRFVDEAELRRIDPELRSFWNVNTPEDWAEAQRMLASSPSRGVGERPAHGGDPAPQTGL